MARLVWNRPGERRFETGIDRGVLYPSTGGAVAWNGLLSVDESVSGSEAKAFYIDGYKYANIPGREEYTATIEAYTYPPEFEECDGTRHVGRGLYFGHQKRKPFGLSYRTLIGNDTNGVDHGYKLHIVYNALAAPSDKEYASMNDSTEAMTFSWSVTTKPVRTSGYRPISHIVIDSTKTQYSLLVAVQDILYGNHLGNGRLPTPTELKTMFEGWPEMEVVYNGDGTYTVTGPDSIVSLLNPEIFQIDSPAALNNGNGTFNVS